MKRQQRIQKNKRQHHMRKLSSCQLCVANTGSRCPSYGPPLCWTVIFSSSRKRRRTKPGLQFGLSLFVLTMWGDWFCSVSVQVREIVGSGQIGGDTKPLSSSVRCLTNPERPLPLAGAGIVHRRWKRGVSDRSLSLSTLSLSSGNTFFESCESVVIPDSKEADESPPCSCCFSRCSCCGWLQKGASVSSQPAPSSKRLIMRVCCWNPSDGVFFTATSLCVRSGWTAAVTLELLRFA